MKTTKLHKLMTFKFQQGGAAPQQGGAQDLQQQVVALVQAAMQGDKQARAQVQQIMDAAQQGNQQAVQIAQMIQEVVTAMQSQARKQQIGGKLAYIHQLRTGVGLDEEVTYAKCGGKMVKKVTKKSCGGPAKKPKAETGGTVKTQTYFEKCGGKAKVAKKKKCYFGGSL